MEEGKVFKIVNGDISDGYHTFDELYEHRCLLYLAWIKSDGCLGDRYWIPDHFRGWDLVVTNLPDGQVSYHIPIKFRPLYENRFKINREHKFDGHTSDDVIERIKRWLSFPQPPEPKEGEK